MMRLRLIATLQFLHYIHSRLLLEASTNVQWMEWVWHRPGQAEWEKQTLVNASADFSQPDQQLAEGKQALGPVAYLIDGKDENAWKADRGEGRRNQASQAVVQFEKLLECPPKTEIKVVMRMKDMLGCCRVSTTTAANPTAATTDYAAVQASLTPIARKSSEPHCLPHGEIQCLNCRPPPIVPLHGKKTESALS